jgi:hypothetical protein
MIQRIKRTLPSYTSRRTVANCPRVEKIQRWVETADERCPLACVWFALPEIAGSQDDEPDRTQPAFSGLSLKAGCLHPIHTLPTPSILGQIFEELDTYNRGDPALGGLPRRECPGAGPYRRPPRPCRHCTRSSNPGGQDGAHHVSPPRLSFPRRRAGQHHLSGAWTVSLPLRRSQQSPQPR